MTDRERKSMTRAGLLLAGAALIRFLAAPPPAEAPLAGRDSIADSLVAAGDSAIADKERRSRPFEPGETIDPNVAGEEELDRLPGVGAAKAARIVMDREENGPFGSVEDLARVAGIGPGSIERLRPFLWVAAGARGSFRPSRRARAVAAPDAAAPDAALSGAAVNLNRATASELRQLPGIGPVTADRIVAYREQHGPFRTPEDLIEVSGIGPRTLERLAPLVTVRQ